MVLSPTAPLQTRILQPALRPPQQCKRLPTLPPCAHSSLFEALWSTSSVAMTAVRILWGSPRVLVRSHAHMLGSFHISVCDIMPHLPASSCNVFYTHVILLAIATHAHASFFFAYLTNNNTRALPCFLHVPTVCIDGSSLCKTYLHNRGHN